MSTFGSIESTLNSAIQNLLCLWLFFFFIPCYWKRYQLCFLQYCIEGSNSGIMKTHLWWGQCMWHWVNIDWWADMSLSATVWLMDVFSNVYSRLWRTSQYLNWFIEFWPFHRISWGEIQNKPLNLGKKLYSKKTYIQLCIHTLLFVIQHLFS